MQRFSTLLLSKCSGSLRPARTHDKTYKPKNLVLQNGQQIPSLSPAWACCWFDPRQCQLAKAIIHSWKTNWGQWGRKHHTFQSLNFVILCVLFADIYTHFARKYKAFWTCPKSELFEFNCQQQQKNDAARSITKSFIIICNWSSNLKCFIFVYITGQSLKSLT
jgi:hypothetical protein